MPLLHHRIGQNFPNIALSDSQHARLKQSYQKNAARNLVLFKHLKPVLVSLFKAQIPAIILKGAYLAAEVYDNLVLRQMRDIDILVSPQDLASCDACLRSAGFQCKERTPTPTRETNELHYVIPGQKIMIEIHWDLYKPDYPFQVDLDEMRRSAIPVLAAGVEARAFAPEDQLIHLASHTTIHRFEFGLRSLCDLAEMITRFPINWPLLCQKAVNQKMARAVGVPLILARDLLGVKIPDPALEDLLPDGLPDLLLEEAKETVLLNRRGHRKLGEPNPNLLLFMGRDGWRNRLVLIKNRFFPSRETIASMYPVAVNSPRIWFYYLSHDWKIIQRNLLGLKTILNRKFAMGKTQTSAAELMNWLLK